MMRRTCRVVYRANTGFVLKSAAGGLRILCRRQHHHRCSRTAYSDRISSTDGRNRRIGGRAELGDGPCLASGMTAGRGRSRSDQAVADRGGGGGGAGPHFQLGVDVGDVGGDGAPADKEGGGDLAVGPAIAE
jgi:hypothetical protein